MAQLFREATWVPSLPEPPRIFPNFSIPLAPNESRSTLTDLGARPSELAAAQGLDTAKPAATPGARAARSRASSGTRSRTTVSQARTSSRSGRSKKKKKTDASAISFFRSLWLRLSARNDGAITARKPKPVNNQSTRRSAPPTANPQNRTRAKLVPPPDEVNVTIRGGECLVIRLRSGEEATASSPR